MARILIIGSDEDASALAGALERDGHVVVLATQAERQALEHVAIVCWLAGASPESFLSRAVDSTMRGFVYWAGGPERGADSEGALLDIASRNSIPVAMLRRGLDDAQGWLDEARAAVERLLMGARS